MAREHKQYDQESNKRIWRCTFVDSKRVKNHNFDVSIVTSTRTEHPTLGVPEKIYSSLKYDQQHIITGDLLEEFGFIVVKIHVINPESGEEIKMVNRPILKGTTEASVAAQGNPLSVQAKLRWQFTGCSYHHQRKQFTFVASYYTPQDLETPLIQMTSAPFLVYARKPTPSDPMAKAKPRGIHTKRMREGKQTSTPSPRPSRTHPQEQQTGKQLKEEEIEPRVVEGQPPAKVAKTLSQPQQQPQIQPFSLMEQQYGQLPEQQQQQQRQQPQQQSQLQNLPQDKKELLNLFRTKVEELEQLRAQLTPEQQEEATNLIYHKLLHTSPPFYGLFSPQNQQQQFTMPQSQDVFDLGALLPTGMGWGSEEDSFPGQGSPNHQPQYLQPLYNNNNNNNNNNVGGNNNKPSHQQQDQEQQGQTAQQQQYPSVMPSPEDEFYQSNLLS